MQIHICCDGAFGDVNIGMPVGREGHADHRRIHLPVLWQGIKDTLVRRVDPAPEYHVHDPLGQREGTGSGLNADTILNLTC